MKNYILFFILAYFVYPVFSFSQTTQKVRSAKALATKHATSFSKIKNAKNDRSFNFDKTFSMSLTQAYNLNSASGIENIFGINLEGDYNSSYHKGNFSALNYGEYEIEFTKQGIENFFKNEDLISITTDVGFDISKNYMLGLLVDLNTQTFPGYAYPEIDSVKISDFMSPGYLSIGLGLTYYKTNKFSIFISPASFHSEIVNKKLDDQKIYNHSGNAKLYNSVGSLLKIAYHGPIAKNVTLKSSLELYSNYLRTPQNMEVYFPSTFQLKVNKYLSVKINLNARYNHYTLLPIFDIIDHERVQVGRGPRLQITESVGIGFTL